MEEARAFVANALGKSLDEVPDGGAVGETSGWDSLGHMRLMLALEARLRRSLDAREIISVRSVADIARLLSNGG